MAFKSGQRVCVAVYVLVILFGIASWVDINGLWVELPVMVQELPEGWSLPSYMVILIQVANLGPLIYTLTSVHCPRRLPEKMVIYVIIGVGVSACILLVFFWNTTTLIGGRPHSTALFILNFFLALVDTTSSVAFLPFMAIFKPIYMTAYFIGEGFSGLLPGLMGLAQGAGRVVCLNVTEHQNVTVNGTTYADVLQTVRPSYIDTNFSIETFFLFIGGMIVVSGISFTLLNYHPRCRREYSARSVSAVANSELVRDEARAYTLDKCETIHHEDEQSGMITAVLDVNFIDSTSREGDGSTLHLRDVADTYGSRMTGVEYIMSLVLTGYASALTNAVLISVQTYSCLPYGTSPYHLSVTLANVANPLASFLAFFVYVTSVPALCGLTVIGSFLGAYIMAAAGMSPHPVLVGVPAGGTLIVIVWVMCVFVLTYVRVSLAALCRTEGKKGLLYCGAATQIGSAIGGVIMFVLVNVLHLFVMVRPCSV